MLCFDLMMVSLFLFVINLFVKRKDCRIVASCCVGWLLDMLCGLVIDTNKKSY